MEKFDEEPSVRSMSEIQSFFKNASVFITGASGFLGHVLLAKLIRSCPDIKIIYILLRRKKGKCESQRLQELLQDEVFEELRAECPEIILKIHPIAGDCQLSKLGISEVDERLLKSEINVVFHVAATTKFDAPLKHAVNVNVRSTRDLLNMAHDMKQLKSFVHVSTAFSNSGNFKVIEEKFYLPLISAEKFIMLVENMDEKIIDNITPSLLGTSPNTYVFTKGVAEDICRTKGVGLPLVIFRPAIVISTAKEPLPGWINNVYGPIGITAAIAAGLLHVVQVDSNLKANVVPCDYVVNAIIASAWNVGTRHIPNEDLKIKQTTQNLFNDEEIVEVERSKNHIPIYNFSCNLVEKPHTWAEFIKYYLDMKLEIPSSQSIWVASLLKIKNKTVYRLCCLLLHSLPAFLADSVATLIGKELKLLNVYKKLHKAIDVLSYFSMREWTMTNNNVHLLWSNLSEKDKVLFDFNLQNIEWVEYIRDYSRGIRKFILKEDPKTIPSARRRRLVLLFLHKFLLFVLVHSSLYMLYRIVLILLKLNF